MGAFLSCFDNTLESQHVAHQSIQEDDNRGRDINNVQPSGEAASVGTQHAGQDIIGHSVNAVSRSLVTTHDDVTRKRGDGVTSHESEEADPEPSNTSRAAGVAEVCVLTGHQWLVVGLPEEVEVEGGSSGCSVQVHCSPGPAGAAAPLSHLHCRPLPGRLLLVKRRPTSPLTAAAAASSSGGDPAASYAVTVHCLPPSTLGPALPISCSPSPSPSWSCGSSAVNSTSSRGLQGSSWGPEQRRVLSRDGSRGQGPGPGLSPFASSASTPWALSSSSTPLASSPRLGFNHRQLCWEDLPPAAAAAAAAPAGAAGGAGAAGLDHGCSQGSGARPSHSSAGLPRAHPAALLASSLLRLSLNPHPALIPTLALSLTSCQLQVHDPHPQLLPPAAWWGRAQEGDPAPTTAAAGWAAATEAGMTTTAAAPLGAAAAAAAPLGAAAAAAAAAAPAPSFTVALAAAPAPRPTAAAGCGGVQQQPPPPHLPPGLLARALQPRPAPAPPLLRSSPTSQELGPNTLRPRELSLLDQPLKAEAAGPDTAAASQDSSQATHTPHAACDPSLATHPARSPPAAAPALLCWHSLEPTPTPAMLPMRVASEQEALLPPSTTALHWLTCSGLGPPLPHSGCSAAAPSSSCPAPLDLPSLPAGAISHESSSTDTRNLDRSSGSQSGSRPGSGGEGGVACPALPPSLPPDLPEAIQGVPGDEAEQGGVEQPGQEGAPAGLLMLQQAGGTYGGHEHGQQDAPPPRPSLFKSHSQPLTPTRRGLPLAPTRGAVNNRSQQQLQREGRAGRLAGGQHAGRGGEATRGEGGQGQGEGEPPTSRDCSLISNLSLAGLAGGGALKDSIVSLTSLRAWQAVARSSRSSPHCGAGPVSQDKVSSLPSRGANEPWAMQMELLAAQLPAPLPSSHPTPPTPTPTPTALTVLDLFPPPTPPLPPVQQQGGQAAAGGEAAARPGCCQAPPGGPGGEGVPPLHPTQPWGVPAAPPNQRARASLLLLPSSWQPSPAPPPAFSFSDNKLHPAGGRGGQGGSVGHALSQSQSSPPPGAQLKPALRTTLLLALPPPPPPPLHKSCPGHKAAPPMTQTPTADLPSGAPLSAAPPAPRPLPLGQAVTGLGRSACLAAGLASGQGCVLVQAEVAALPLSSLLLASSSGGEVQGEGGATLGLGRHHLLLLQQPNGRKTYRALLQVLLGVAESLAHLHRLHLPHGMLQADAIYLQPETQLGPAEQAAPPAAPAAPTPAPAAIVAASTQPTFTPTPPWAGCGSPDPPSPLTAHLLSVSRVAAPVSLEPSPPLPPPVAAQGRPGGVGQPVHSVAITSLADGRDGHEGQGRGSGSSWGAGLGLASVPGSSQHASSSAHSSAHSQAPAAPPATHPLPLPPGVSPHPPPTPQPPPAPCPSASLPSQTRSSLPPSGRPKGPLRLVWVRSGLGRRAVRLQWLALPWVQPAVEQAVQRARGAVPALPHRSPPDPAGLLQGAAGRAVRQPVGQPPGQGPSALPASRQLGGPAPPPPSPRHSPSPEAPPLPLAPAAAPPLDAPWLLGSRASTTSDQGPPYGVPAPAWGGAHVAPELFNGGPPSCAADVYAFGILMWELYHGQRAFTDQPAALLRHVCCGQLRPVFALHCASAYRQLAQGCMMQDPASRPKAGQLVRILRRQLRESEHWPEPHSPPAPAALDSLDLLFL